MSEIVKEMAVISLTAEEKQIIALVAQGYTNREIAAKLRMAEDVIKHGIYCNICDKLGVSNRLELAHWVLHHELWRQARRRRR